MLNKSILTLVLFKICIINVSADLRFFNDIFPDMNQSMRNSVFSNSGYIRTTNTTNGINLIGSSNEYSVLDPQIVNIVINKNPSYLAESILVISGEAGDVSLLDVYNSLQNIRGLKGRLYDSATRNQAVPLFEEATRIVSEKQNTPVPDPPPASVIPSKETIYIRLKDINFGNSFYRGEMVQIHNGLCFTLSNFKNLTYFLIPVVKEGKLTAQLYFEPIQEGILIYGIAGTDVSEFFASRISMGSAISKRLGVITSWAVDGIKSR